VGQELVWTRLKGFPRSFELKSTDESFAVLTRRRGTHFIGETAEGRWSFKRSGFIHQRVSIRAGDSEQDFATVAMSWKGCGTLELPPSRRYQWTQVSFWRQRYAFRDERSREMLQAYGGSFGKLRVSIGPEARGVEELPLLVLLSGYLMMLMADDAAASVAASAATFAAVGS
jgi:hypothetical protein